jgi:hypothetical protein
MKFPFTLGRLIFGGFFLTGSTTFYSTRLSPSMRNPSRLN